MTVHVPGLLWAAAFFAAALVARSLPDAPPPRHVIDKYLHIPSTFPTRLANQGLHRPMAGRQAGMSPTMQPYGPAGVAPSTSSMAKLARSLATWATVFLAMAVLSPHL